VRTGEEFLEFARALAASGVDVTKPTPFDDFLETHPAAKRFIETPKPIPSSFARESFFSVSAYRFTNADGVSRYGRYRIRPKAGNEYLTEAEAEAKSPDFLFDELSARLGNAPIELGLHLQLAAAGDEVADATVAWPADRQEVELGVITLTKRANDADPEMRKIIFDPIPRVDGIESSADPLIDVRAALYLLSGRRRRAAAKA
jgi:catalase